MNYRQKMSCRVIAAVLMVSCFVFTIYAFSPFVQLAALSIVSQSDSPSVSNQGGGDGTSPSVDKDAFNMQLLDAVLNGDGQKINDCLAQGADVNANNQSKQTALMIAMDKGNCGIAMLLVNKGANVSAKDAEGCTVLMHAANGGCSGLVKLFIEAGVGAVNAKAHDGRTALMFASRNGHTAAASLLIEKGAAVNDKTNDGRTALMFAAHNGHVETVKLLLEKVADRDAVDNSSKTALAYATEGRRDGVVKLLTPANNQVAAAAIAPQAAPQTQSIQQAKANLVAAENMAPSAAPQPEPVQPTTARLENAAAVSPANVGQETQASNSAVNEGAPTASQQGSYIVYLKNGEVVKGDILDEAPGVNIKVRQMNNDVVTLDDSAIAKIVRMTGSDQSSQNQPGIAMSNPASGDSFAAKRESNAAASTNTAAVTAMTQSGDSGNLILKKGWLFSKYYHNGIQIKNGDDWRAIYSNNPQALSQYDAFRAWAVPVYICECACLVCECIALFDDVSAASSSNLSQVCNLSNQATGWTTIGVGYLVVGIPFAIISRVHFSNAINMYNGKVSLEATHNGIGLCLKF